MTEQLDTQTRGHHPHSPSSLQSSEACAHFENEQRDSKASKDGVLQHKAAETRDLSILDDPEHVKGVTRALQVEDEWIDILTDVEASYSRAGEPEPTEVLPKIIQEQYLPVDGKHVEPQESQELEEDKLTGEKILFDRYREWHGITGGYPDTVLLQLRSGRAAILDWKFGKEWVTPTRDNMQGRAYAAGVFEAFPSVKSVTVVFYHPHLEVNDEGEVYQKDEYTCTFTRDELDFIRLQIHTIIAKKKLAREQGLNNSEIPQTPKTSLCIWCAHKARCKALGALVVLTMSKHKPLDCPEVINPGELRTAEDYGKAYKFANFLEPLAKSIKKHITEAAVKGGVDVDGFEIARRRDSEVVDPSKLKQIAVENFGVTEAEFDKCVSVPITKIDDVIKAKAPPRKGAPTVRAFRDAATRAGALKIGEGYFYLKEVKGEKTAIQEKDLDI